MKAPKNVVIQCFLTIRKVNMSEQSSVLNAVDERLQQLANDAINALALTGAGQVVDKSAAEQAQYEIGAVMAEAKQLFQGNKNRFGKWRDENIIGNGQHTVDKRTLTRWSYLYGFGTLEECRKVGFTNVYKLAGKTYSPLREQVREHLKQNPDVLSDDIKVMLKEFSHQLKTEKEKTKQSESNDLLNKLAEMESRLKELEVENDKLRQQLQTHPQLDAA
jgi:lipoate-protein ligase A